MFTFLDRQSTVLHHQVMATVVTKVELEDIIHALGSLGIEALLQFI